MTNNSLLVELFVEELPPKALKKLGEAFASVLFDALKAQGLTGDASVVTHFATPRRLAALITAVSAKAADKQVAQKLMPASVGLDASGDATPALLKRLQGLGADDSAVAKLRKENDGKADVLFFDAMQTGVNLAEGLQKAFDEALAKLPIPKVMTYQINDGWQSVNFVRPAHGLIALHGSEIVPINILGLSAGNTTQGHRFEAKKVVITIESADSYAKQLSDEGAVIASFETRKAEIASQLAKAAAKEGLTPIEDDALLDEVTALVELPNVLLGQFEPEFLEVPQECLILTMKANQKYFPLLDSNHKLTNQFLIVSNIKPADPSKVIGGNERVVRPRLADAKFFFDQDRKKTLSNMCYGLSKVVYHNQLGTQQDRVNRVVSIIHEIISQSSLLADTSVTNANFVAGIEIAARLAKADLLSEMVGEFPELQGIMGRYYAQPEYGSDIAYAIEDHYKPKFSGDDLPRNKTGEILALADKLETLVGLFSIGEKPTGDKDPFALRRHALGIVRIIIERGLFLTLPKLLKGVLSAFEEDFYEHQINDLVNEINEFCISRLSVNLREQGYSAQEVEAVLTKNNLFLKYIPQSLLAVRSFSALAEAPTLAAANKRVTNILKKAEGEVKTEVNADLLQEPAEKALNEALNKVKPQADKLFESGDYTASLQTLAALKAPVDDFFDNVMVNAEDIDLKNNRLALLNQLHQTMNRVADLSKLAS